MKTEKIFYVILAVVLMVGLFILIGAGGNGSVGKYQLSTALLGTGEMGSKTFLVAVIDTETGVVKLKTYTKAPESINLFE